MFKRRPRFLMLATDDADTGGTAAQPQEPSAPTEQGGQDTQDQPRTEDADEPLGEGGKRALAAEREAHRAAQRDLAAARQSITEITAQRDEAQAELEALRLDRARHAAGVAAGLKPELIDRIQGATPEEMQADAKALADIVNARPAPYLPPDPSQGRGSAGKGAGSAEAGRDLYRQRHKTPTEKE